MYRFASLLLMMTAAAAQAQNPPPVFPIADCMSVSDQIISVRFGYESQAVTVLTLPVTPDDNIVIGGGISPWVGQPVVFVPGRHRDVFRADFDLAESPTYSWVLAGRFLRIDDSLPLCRDREQRQLIGLLECLQPPGAGNALAQARFAYVNLGGSVSLPARSSRNYFGPAGNVFAASGQRGQPFVFAPGAHRNAFTVSFDPVAEPLLIWQIDGESVPASLDLPNVPLCTPLASAVFRDGFEPSA